jgi:hypothetical protein
LLRRVRRGVLARHQKWWEWWYPSLDERMKFGERSGTKSVRLNVRMMPKERERVGGNKYLYTHLEDWAGQ